MQCWLKSYFAREKINWFFFLQSPHVVGGTLCFQFFYSASGASFTWTSQGTNLIFVLISTYKLLTNLFYTFCTITAALRNWISLVKVSYQGNFHGRFLTIILHLSAKAALRLYSLAFRVHFPDGALTENILSTKKLQKVHSIQSHL